jgi:hypothetical protein
MSKPLIKAVPEVGLKIVHSMWMSVVLPAPLGPSSPKISPFLINLALYLNEYYVHSGLRLILTAQLIPPLIFISISSHRSYWHNIRPSVVIVHLRLHTINPFYIIRREDRNRVTSGKNLTAIHHYYPICIS